MSNTIAEVMIDIFFDRPTTFAGQDVVKARFSLPLSNWIVQRELQSGASRRFIPSPLEILELR